MRINLGYVCQTKTLSITSSSSMTYTNFVKYNDYEKLDKVIISNLVDLYTILKYNYLNDIKFFRLSSQLIPLATHELVKFEYIDKFKCYFDKLKEFTSLMRLDFHPDQFTVLNSIKEDVIKRSIDNLEYHYKLLCALDINPKILILHVGSSVFGKIKSIERFIKNFRLLPDYLQSVIAIENDDKIFNVNDCLYICKELKIPLVLDIHHHNCNNDGEEIIVHLDDIFNTWGTMRPKIHFSSPKSRLKKEYRSHSEFIDCDEFIKFIEVLKLFDRDVDIMLEAKGKDEALFRLVRELKYRDLYKIDVTSIIV